MDAVFEALIAEGWKVARKAAGDWATGKAGARGWTIEGTFERGDCRADGLCKIIIPADNPLRLVSPRREWAMVCPLAEFESDGGSIPRALQMHNAALDLRPWAYPAAYILHDALYQVARAPLFDLVAGGWGWADIPRAVADAAAAVSLAASGATRATVAAVYGSLAVFGGIAWDAWRRQGLPAGAVLFDFATA